MSNTLKVRLLFLFPSLFLKPSHCSLSNPEVPFSPSKWKLLFTDAIKTRISVVDWGGKRNLLVGCLRPPMCRKSPPPGTPHPTLRAQWERWRSGWGWSCSCPPPEWCTFLHTVQTLRHCIPHGFPPVSRPDWPLWTFSFSPWSLGRGPWCWWSARRIRRWCGRWRSGCCSNRHPRPEQTGCQSWRSWAAAPGKDSTPADKDLVFELTVKLDESQESFGLSQFWLFFLDQQQIWARETSKQKS